MCGEIGPDLQGVGLDLGLQGIQGVEADLVPEVLVKLHPDGLAVKVAVEIQHPGFYRQVAGCPHW